jgi:hypothetical protein
MQDKTKRGEEVIINRAIFNNSRCDHDFKFSHIEYPPNGTYASIPQNKEVVICRKCGEIRKFIQQ